MATFKLWISEFNQPQLQRTWFEHPQFKKPRVSVRGKKETLYTDSGTFQWTPAVQALTLLLVRSAAANPAGPRPILEGEKGSPGASLGFILLKKPAWLKEMFGEFRPGALVITRFIRTYNIGFRHPGPMAIALHDHAELEIKVLVGDKEITDPAALELIAQKIETEWRPHRQTEAVTVISSGRQDNSAGSDDTRPLNLQIERSDTGGPAGSGEDFISIVRIMLEQECRQRLWKTDIFSSKSRDEIIGRIYDQPMFVKSIGKKVDLVHEVDRSLSTGERLGVSRGGNEAIPPEIRKFPRPITIAVPVISAGSKACFYRLKERLGAHLELREGFTHSGDILDLLVKSSGGPEIDFIQLGIGTVAEVLSRQSDFPYRPFMILPKHSLRIVSPRGPRSSAHRSGRLDSGNYVVTGDGPTSPRFALDDLFKNIGVDRSRVRMTFAEPDDSFQLLKSGDPELRSLLFFPHYQFNCLWNDCRLLAENEEEHQMRDTVMLVHERLAGEFELLRAVDIMIRDAWLTLRSSETELHKTVSQMIAAPGFLSTLKRSAGLYSVPSLLNDGALGREPAERFSIAGPEKH